MGTHSNEDELRKQLKLWKKIGQFLMTVNYILIAFVVIAIASIKDMSWTGIVVEAFLLLSVVIVCNWIWKEESNV